MSLYGDLPQAKDKDAGDAGSTKGWASASKKLQPSFRPSSVAVPASLRPSSAVAAAGRAGGGRGVTDGGRGGGRGGPPPVIRASPSSSAAAGSLAASVPPQQLPGPVKVHGGPHPAGILQQQHRSALSLLQGQNGEPLREEYDPSRPNDFEEIMKQREKRKREAEEEAERAARLREAEQEAERRKQEQAAAAAFIAAASKPPHQQPSSTTTAAGGGGDNTTTTTNNYTDADSDAEFGFKGGLGSSSAQQQQQQQPAQHAGPTAAAAAAGPGPGSAAAAAAGGNEAVDDYEAERQRRLRMSGDEAFAARARLRGASPAGHPPSSSSQQPPQSSSSLGGGLGLPGLQNPNPAGQQAGGLNPAAAPKGMGLAQKLLEKMGWREGQGLGRNRQGMATPLVAQKTAAHAGVIVSAELPPDAKRPKLQGAAFNGPPTRILVLRNMVGPGEVDEDLEEEVGNELTKYGIVQDVMIFEVTTAGYAPEEAVRIFIKFDRAEAATRALVDLQGRFFAGRQVRAAFFSEDRFDKQQLAPQQGEFGDS